MPRASSGRSAQVTISTPSGGSMAGGAISLRCSTTPSSRRSSTNPRRRAKARLSGSLSRTGASSSLKPCRAAHAEIAWYNAEPAPRRRCSASTVIEREDAIGALRGDRPDRGADGDAVQAREVVDVGADARLERAHLVHGDGVVRPDGVVDVQREPLVRRVRSGGHLEHAATIRPDRPRYAGVATPPSSSGLGRRPFTPVARVRIPLGVPQAHGPRRTSSV